MAMGEMLAEEVKRVLAAENLHVDVVIPVGHFFRSPHVPLRLNSLATLGP